MSRRELSSREQTSSRPAAASGNQGRSRSNQPRQGHQEMGGAAQQQRQPRDEQQAAATRGEGDEQQARAAAAAEEGWVGGGGLELFDLGFQTLQSSFNTGPHGNIGPVRPNETLACVAQSGPSIFSNLHRPSTLVLTLSLTCSPSSPQARIDSRNGLAAAPPPWLLCLHPFLSASPILPWSHPSFPAPFSLPNFSFMTD